MRLDDLQSALRGESISPPDQLRERILEEAPGFLPPIRRRRPPVLHTALTIFLAAAVVALLLRPEPGPLLVRAPGPAPVPAPRTPPESSAAAFAPGDDYRYDPAGRRDPYVSFWERGTGREEIHGMRIVEVRLEGIVTTPREVFAVVKGKDDRGYNLRIDDELSDGRVKAIDQGGVVFVREASVESAALEEIRLPLNAELPG